MVVYMAVTNDKYEFPVDIGTAKELAKKFNITQEQLKNYSRAIGAYKNRREITDVNFVRVVLQEEDE